MRYPQKTSSLCCPFSPFTTYTQTFCQLFLWKSLQRCYKSFPPARLPRSAPPAEVHHLQVTQHLLLSSRQRCPSASPSQPLAPSRTRRAAPAAPRGRHAELGINYNLSTSGSLAFRAQSQFSAGPTVTHAHVCTHTHACTVIVLYFPELFFSQLFMREKTALYCAVPFLLPYLLPGALYNCDAFVTAPASYQ